MGVIGASTNESSESQLTSRLSGPEDLISLAIPMGVTWAQKVT